MFYTIKRAFDNAFGLPGFSLKKPFQQMGVTSAKSVDVMQVGVASANFVDVMKGFVASPPTYSYLDPRSWEAAKYSDPFVEKKVKAHGSDEESVTAVREIPGGWPSDPAVSGGRQTVQLQRHGKNSRNYNRSVSNTAKDLIIDSNNGEKHLPPNYSRTSDGMRFHTHDEYPDDHKCGHIGEHKLVCGHWVNSDLPCGSTCRDVDYDNDAFICPICCDIIRDCVEQMLTLEEQDTLRQCLHNTGLTIVKLVELTSRLLPQVKGGIAETVRCLVTRGQYGRPCKAFKASMGAFDAMVVQGSAHEAQRKKIGMETKQEAALVKHAKRKATFETPTTPDASINTPLPDTPSSYASSIFSSPPTLSASTTSTTSWSTSSPFTPFPKQQKPSTTPFSPVASLNHNTSPPNWFLPTPCTEIPRKRQKTAVHLAIPSSTGNKHPSSYYDSSNPNYKRRRLNPPSRKPTPTKPPIIFYGNTAICKRPNGGNFVIRR